MFILKKKTLIIAAQKKKERWKIKRVCHVIFRIVCYSNIFTLLSIFRARFMDSLRENCGKEGESA